MLDLLHSKLQVPPTFVSVIAFLEDAQRRSQAAGDLAVSQMTAVQPSTMSVQSLNPGSDHGNITSEEEETLVPDSDSDSSSDHSDITTVDLVTSRSKLPKLVNTTPG